LDKYRTAHTVQANHEAVPGTLDDDDVDMEEDDLDEPLD